MFGAYFGPLQDFWFLEVASSLPQVVTAKGKFLCFNQIIERGLHVVFRTLNWERDGNELAFLVGLFKNLDYQK